MIVRACCLFSFRPEAVFTFVRRQGHPLEEAQDLTQSFFARPIEKEELAAADRDRGRFREILKTLALHLASLRARLAETPAEVSSLSDKVRALCDNISQQGMNVRPEDVPTVEQRNAT